MSIRRIVVFFLAVVVVLALAIAFWPRRYEATIYPMGGIPFKVVAYGRNYIQFDRDLTAVENRVGKLERIFNRHSSSSEITKLNTDAQDAQFWVSPDIENVLNLSRKWYLMTKGAFDPTVVPLIDLWTKAGETKVLPSEQDVGVRLEAVGLDKVKLMDDGKVLFTKRGMGLDFGAIAKGYIVDQAVRVLLKRGVKRGVVEAGGDALAFGGGSFKFGIQDPTKGIGKLMGTVEVSNGAVVTSGDYARYVEIGGKKYSHIMNPVTGYPVDSGIVSVTVVGGDAAAADALATSIMVLGKEKGLSLTKGMGRVELIIVQQVDDGFQVLVTPGLISHLSFDPEWQARLKTL